MQPTQPPIRGGSSSRPSSHPGFEPESAAAGVPDAGAGGFDAASRPDKGSPDACLSGVVGPTVDADRGRPESTFDRNDQGGAGDFADAARRQAHDLKGGAQQLAQDAKQKAGDVVGQLKDGVKGGAQQATEQAKQVASDAARMLRERGQEAFGQQKERAANELGNISAAIHKAGEKLDQDKDHNIACVVHGFAEQVGRLSDYVRGQDVGRLMQDAQRFGRQRPELLLGGMFVAGMALARFLKASSAKPQATGASASDNRGDDDRTGGAARETWTEPGMYSATPARTPYDRMSYEQNTGTAVRSGGDALLVRGNAGSDELRGEPSMPQAPSFNLTGESMATTRPASSSADLAGAAGQLPSPETAVRGSSFVPTLDQDFEPAGGGTAGAGLNPVTDTADAGNDPEAYPPAGGLGGGERR